MEWQELRTQLIRLLERCRRLDALPAQRIDDALDLVRHDEGLIALENLCSNLDDALVEVPADIIDEIRRLGSIVKLDDKYWRRLTPEQRNRPAPSMTDDEHERLLAVIDVCQTLPHAPQGFLDRAASLARTGGWRLALEDLCSRLHGANIEVPPDIIAEIKLLVSALRLDDRFVRMVERAQ